jgi:hypothetical protein
VSDEGHGADFSREQLSLPESAAHKRRSDPFGHLRVVELHADQAIADTR